MKILNEILAGLDYDAPVREIRMGPFQTGVFTRYCALASTPHQASPHHESFPVKEAGSLLEKSARELAFMAESENVFEAAVGMAAINSLLEVDESRFENLNAADILAREGEGKRIAIIGHFPFIGRLRRIASQVWVIEKNPRDDDFTEDDGARLIPQADVVGITGTAFTNHTIENILAACAPRAYVMVLGDTTPLMPLLFEYGIDCISGTRVVDPAAALRCASQGATFRQLKGIRLLAMEKS